MPGVSATRPTLRILFTCAGRRVELLRAFRRAGRALRCRLEIHAADSSPLAPALYHADRAHSLPPVDAPAFARRLLALLRKQAIDLLVPLSDLELPVLADLAPRIVRAGCTPLISAPRVVDICRDKIKTFCLLRGAGIDTPDTWTWAQVRRRRRHRFPYFLKPRFGSAAVGNFVIRNRRELEALTRRVRDPILQEYVPGTEHTLDVYTGFDGAPRCVVPRRRIEVRGGEVSKATVVKDPSVIEAGYRVADALEDGRGLLTVQCMVTADRRVRVIEINPRFGGGVPLAIRAGADFPRWILAELIGRTPRIDPDGYRDGMTMLRFDDSVFLPRLPRKTP